MKVLLKNGTKVRVSQKEAVLIADFLLNTDNRESRYFRTFVGEKLLRLFKCEEVVAII